MSTPWALRGDKRSHVAVAGIEAVDDAGAVRLEPCDEWLEIGDLEREMVQALTAFVDEPPHEALRPRGLDQLQLELSDIEVTPVEVVRITGTLLDAHLDRQAGTEEPQGGVDVVDGNRDVIDA
jgi:hypothetical protein